MNIFLKKYKEKKTIRDIIKRRIYSSKLIDVVCILDNHDFQYKITHIKGANNIYNDIYVNLKVCGKIGSYSWLSDKNFLCDITNTHAFNSTISRNKRIRENIKKSVIKQLILFGVNPYNVEIAKITVVESL